MPLSTRDISEIEKAYPGGLSSKQIIEIQAAHGEHISEATLRKYVQLGLLPHSRRVGEKGKHRGSRGIYPVEIIRRIDEIRRAMTEGATLEELAKRTQAMRARLASVRASLGQVLNAAESDLTARDLDRAARSSLKSQFSTLSREAQRWLRSMERWSASLQQAERRRGNGKHDHKLERGVGKVERTNTMARPSRRPGGM